MERSASTFSQVARAVAARHVPAEEAIEGAISALGGKAEWNIESMDAERKGALVNHFVRSVRNLGVHAASKLEHALLEATGCCGQARRVIALQNAISLIAVRNQVHQLATAMGLAWNDSMRLQSAVSDVARYVIEHGGGRIEIEETRDGLCFAVHAILDLGPISPSAPAPNWLAGTVNLAKGFRANRSPGGSHFEFWFGRPQPMVA